MLQPVRAFRISELSNRGTWAMTVLVNLCRWSVLQLARFQSR